MATNSRAFAALSIYVKRRRSSFLVLTVRRMPDLFSLIIQTLPPSQSYGGQVSTPASHIQCCPRHTRRVGGKARRVATHSTGMGQIPKGAAFLHYRSWDDFWHNLNLKNRRLSLLKRSTVGQAAEDDNHEPADGRAVSVIGSRMQQCSRQRE